MLYAAGVEPSVATMGRGVGQVGKARDGGIGREVKGVVRVVVPPAGAFGAVDARMSALKEPSSSPPNSFVTLSSPSHPRTSLLFPPATSINLPPNQMPPRRVRNAMYCGREGKWPTPSFSGGMALIVGRVLTKRWVGESHEETRGPEGMYTLTHLAP